MKSATKPLSSLLCRLFSDGGGQPAGQEDSQQLNKCDSNTHSDQRPRIVLHFILELQYAAILEVLVLIEEQTRVHMNFGALLIFSKSIKVFTLNKG